MQLFTREEAVLAGWIHYLAFDLFIGTWEIEHALARGVSRFLLILCLALTFMFGPAGLLTYFAVRPTARPSGSCYLNGLTISSPRIRWPAWKSSL
jgi:hypothetical protein